MGSRLQELVAKRKAEWCKAAVQRAEFERDGARSLAAYLGEEPPEARSKEDHTTDNPLPVVKYDPDLLVEDPNPLQRMVPPDDDDDEEPRALRYSPDQPRALRYSPDQPRDPHGRFGNGSDAQTWKTDEFEGFGHQILVKHFQAAAPAWVAGGKDLKAIQADTARAIKGGTAQIDPIAGLIRTDVINEDSVYRGIHNVPDAALADYQVGKDVQLQPQSFTTDRDTAEMFADGQYNDASAFAKNANAKGGNSVVFAIQRPDGPIHGLKVADYAKMNSIKTYAGKTAADIAKNEVISGGHFTVVSHSIDAGTHYITLNQTGVF